MAASPTSTVAAAAPGVGGPAHAGTLAPALGLLVCAATLCAAFWRLSVDDVYITFTYARSLAEGRGLSWNGQPGLGTTSPGLAVALAGLARLTGLEIPVAGHLVDWLARFAGALALLVLGRAEGWPRAGLVAGLAWLLTPTNLFPMGGEMPLTCALVGWTAIAAHRQRYVAAALLAVLAAAVRPEAALAPPTIGCAVFRTRGATARRPLARAGVAGLLAAAAWTTLLRRLSGAVVPQTLAAKRAQAESGFGVWTAGVESVVATVRAAWPPGALALLVALGAATGACVLLRRRAPFAKALVTWGILHVAAIALLRVPAYPWYCFPFYFAVLLAAAFTAEAGQPAPRPTLAGAQRCLAVALVAALAAHIAPMAIRGLRTEVRAPDPVSVNYGAAAEHLDANHPGSRAAVLEAGYMGWAARRTVVLDLLGLVTPGVPLEAIRRGDLRAVVTALAPDFLLLNSTRPWAASAMADLPAFLAEWELERAWLSQPRPVVLYRRRAAAWGGVDLLAANSNLARRAVLREAAGIQLPAVRVPAGTRVRLRCPVPADAVAIYAATEGSDVVLTLRDLRRRRATSAIVTPERGWVRVELALATRTVVEIECDSPAGDAVCVLALPHVERAPEPRKRGGRR